MKNRLKRIAAAAAAVLLLASLPVYAQDDGLAESDAVREPQAELVGNGQDTVTILVYMNGSSLETNGGAASLDLQEMIDAGSSDKVNLLVETVGTSSWSDYNIASDRSQIYRVDGSGLELVRDDMGQMDCTDPDTLSDFISWGARNYPADRYILLLWDHGGGPVYGFGYDEWVEDSNASLTVDEIQTALKDGGVYFDFIGMDCCLMATMEVCCALYDYCDYTIMAEDFEPGYGWYYTDWLSELYDNTSVPTKELGESIIDDMVEYNNEYGLDAILALVDEGVMPVLYTAWKDFAYANEDVLLELNYSQPVIDETEDRLLPSLERAESENNADGRSVLDYFFYDITMADYFVTDIMAVAQTISSDESSALSAAVSQSVVYMNSSESDAALTGLSVTLPYGDSDFYNKLQGIFLDSGFDEEYVTWLGKFKDVPASQEYFDYSEFIEEWAGWAEYIEDFDWAGWLEEYGEDYWNSEDWGWDEWQYGEDWEAEDYAAAIDAIGDLFGWR